jgi:hypothetical protein
VSSETTAFTELVKVSVISVPATGSVASLPVLVERSEYHNSHT